jgi:hypothetical protein
LLLVAVVLFPVSNRLSRWMAIILLGAIWIGGLILLWRRPILRWGLLLISAVAAGLLFGPSREFPSAQTLRPEYLASLRRYDGVTYYWGGENLRGIDCSGLVRRGMIDALFLRGIRTFHPGLIRESLSQWWKDCTASTLGKGLPPLTSHIMDAPSINALQPDQILPGDLAVTANGVHVLAYLGDSTWIEADPDLNRVIQVKVPAPGNSWFESPVRIVRWRNLQ